MSCVSGALLLHIAPRCVGWCELEFGAGLWSGAGAVSCFPGGLFALLTDKAYSEPVMNSCESCAVM